MKPRGTKRVCAGVGENENVGGQGGGEAEQGDCVRGQPWRKPVDGTGVQRAEEEAVSQGPIFGGVLVVAQLVELGVGEQHEEGDGWHSERRSWPMTAAYRSQPTIQLLQQKAQNYWNNLL